MLNSYIFNFNVLSLSMSDILITTFDEVMTEFSLAIKLADSIIAGNLILPYSLNHDIYIFEYLYSLFLMRHVLRLYGM